MIYLIIGVGKDVTRCDLSIIDNIYLCHASPYNPFPQASQNWYKLTQKFFLDFKKYRTEFLYIIIEKKVFTSQVGRGDQQEAEISGKTHSVRKLLITYLGS